MKSFDIVGYAHEGDIYCPDCFQGDRNAEDVSPVFVDDSQPGDSCGICHEYLDGCEPEPKRNRISLTDDGTMDTVLVCECGQEFRYSAPEFMDDEQAEAFDRDEWIDEIIAECEEEHECESEDE